MGKKWTTKEAEEFLQTYVPGYLEAVAQDGTSSMAHGTETRASRYRKSVHGPWFTKFPERHAQFPNIPADQALNLEQQEIVNHAVSTRKGQLNSWFTRQSQKETRGTARDFEKLVKIAEKDEDDVGRAHQQIEPYQMHYADDFKGALEKALVGVNPREGLQIRRNVVQHCWTHTTGEIRKAVMEMWKKEKKEKIKEREEAKEAKKQCDSNLLNGRTAEEYDDACAALPALLNTFLTPVAANTGWTIMVLAGGPNGKDDQRIYTKSYSFGANATESGLEFQDTANFKKNVLVPFGKHIATCYPADACAARVVHSKERIVLPESEDVHTEEAIGKVPEAPWRFSSHGIVSGTADKGDSSSSDKDDEIDNSLARSREKRKAHQTTTPSP
ncbi:hypothetical protein DXG01_015685 [Tephrocybe rancida]|nr:hypothetical protein DXG01_015685 [Tephrocybe rancida]